MPDKNKKDPQKENAGTNKDIYDENPGEPADQKKPPVAPPELPKGSTLDNGGEKRVYRDDETDEQDSDGSANAFDGK